MIEKLIKKFRVEKGWSQPQMARITGISQTTLARWESGAVRPGRESLEKLAQAFGKNIKAFYSLPTLDDGEFGDALKKISKLDSGKQRLIESVINTLYFPNKGLNAEQLAILGSRLRELSPGDQVHVQGLIRRLSEQ